MQLNLDFQKDPCKTVCWILSVFSWLFFLIVGWIGYFQLVIKDYNEDGVSYNTVWSFVNVNYKYGDDDSTSYMPIQEKYAMYIVLFTILMILGTIACALYLFKSTCQKDEQVFEGMMGTVSRYNFIPFICASCLFIIGLTIDISDFGLEIETYSDIDKLKSKINKFLAKFALNLTFSILGLLTLAFIKFQTKIEQPIYIVYSINEGIYSCLIALFTYSLFYSSIYTGNFNKMKTALDKIFSDPKKAVEIIEDIPDFMKGCGIAFSIMIGLINICVGVFLKDVLIPLMNFIIYLGLTIYFFSIEKEEKKESDIKDAEGAFDIIFMVLSLVAIAFNGFRKFRARGLSPS